MLTELGTRQFFSFATMKNLTNFSNLFVPLIWESIGYFTFADASWWSWNWDSSLWSQWEETQAWTCSCLGASHTPPHTDVHCTAFFGEMSELFLDGTVRGNNNRNKAYSRKMMIFCMTLVGYSTKAYSFLRESAKKCLPSVRTLRRYRKRVDGSPGFSTTAMNMIKQKVTEMHNESKQLFLSVSCDDMSIRYIFLTH